MESSIDIPQIKKDMDVGLPEIKGEYRNGRFQK